MATPLANRISCTLKKRQRQDGMWEYFFIIDGLVRHSSYEAEELRLFAYGYSGLKLQYNIIPENK